MKWSAYHDVWRFTKMPPDTEWPEVLLAAHKYAQDRGLLIARLDMVEEKGCRGVYWEAYTPLSDFTNISQI